MRLLVLTVAAFSTMAMPSTSRALDANDTMAAWGKASADDKAKLVAELLKRQTLESATPKVVECLDAAANIPGHADLSIATLVKACAQVAGEPI